MALSKLVEPNEERVDEITERMKEIIETTWLRDPNLNNETAVEYQSLKKEIEDMDMHVSHETRLNLADPSNLKLEAKIIVWRLKNTTIQ